jgi:hypothetical protein
VLESVEAVTKLRQELPEVGLDLIRDQQYASMRST